MKTIVLVTAALEKLQVLGAGQTLSSEDSDLGFRVLNKLVDRWATEALTVLSRLRTQKTLTSGTASYTIGSGGDIDIVRPVEIEDARLVLDINASPQTEIPIDIFTEQRWRAIRQKSLASPLARGVYFDKTFDASQRGKIWPWPVPNVSTTAAVLYTPLAVARFADLDVTEYVLAPGYESALVDELTWDLAPYFNKARTEDLKDDKSASKAAIKRPNMPMSEMVVDQALIGRGGYDIVTDEHRR